MKAPRVGLLPLYLKLYDDVRPDAREKFDPFLRQIAEGFEARGVSATTAGVCRVASEFRAALEQLEAADVDLLVTVHLAYSPSLESVDALTSSSLPLLMLDTTMHADFGPATDPAHILYNHGIHGVQDLASMLRRRGRPYHVVAGHLEESDVLDRAAGIARAARAAHSLRGMRVLRIGETFRGMGDFAVEDDTLASEFGIRVDQSDIEPLREHAKAVTDAEIEEELRIDRERFSIEVPEEVHRRSVRVGLALRRWLEAGGYRAFSQNFLAFTSGDEPIDTVPFLEASKAMSRGLGYAGEGDVLTASLVGALNGTFGDTNFTEMFCPDWKGGTVFLSHMGEFNFACAAGRPQLVERDFPWTKAHNPAVVTAAPAPGPAVLVNLAPGPHDSFDLILAPVEVLGDTTHEAMRNSIRGWIRPECDLAAFLEQYSRFGGTHHCALVHGGRVEVLSAFAEFAGIGCNVIDGTTGAAVPGRTGVAPAAALR